MDNELTQIIRDRIAIELEKIGSADRLRMAKVIQDLDSRGLLGSGVAVARLEAERSELMRSQTEVIWQTLSSTLKTSGIGYSDDLSQELKQLVEGARCIETLHAHPIDKDAMAEELASMRALFTKSIVPQLDLPAGTTLERDHLAFKKPGTGISVDRLEEVVGRRLKRRVQADELLSLEDLE